MTSETLATAVEPTRDLELKRFSKLPAGYQRVAIAVVLVVVLVAVVLLREMIKTEESVRQAEEILPEAIV
jgi:hypothetical protein